MEPLNLTQSTGCPSIDDFRNQVYSTAYSVITVLSLVGNCLALVVLIKTNQSNSSYQVYMINLAVSDLLCVITLPLRVVYYVKKGHWVLGDFLCRISSYMLYVNLYCSIYLLAAMSVTRFLAIVFPVQNMHLVTVRRARLVCVCIWVFICLSSCPFLMTGQKTDPATNKTKCFEPPRESDSLQKLHILNCLSFGIGFVLPFLIILLCYAGIVRALLSRNHASRRQRAIDSKAIRMIFIVLLTFLICFLPYHIQRTVHLTSLSRSDTPCSVKVTMQKMVVVTLSLAAANSCFDPLLYFFSGEGFRSRLSVMRQSMKCSQQLHMTRQGAIKGPVSEAEPLR